MLTILWTRTRIQNSSGNPCCTWHYLEWLIWAWKIHFQNGSFMAGKLVLPADREPSWGCCSGSLVPLHVDLSTGCLDFLTAQQLGSKTGYPKIQEVEAASLLRPGFGNLHSDTSLYSIGQSTNSLWWVFTNLLFSDPQVLASRLEMVTNSMPLIPLRGVCAPFPWIWADSLLTWPSLCSLLFPFWPFLFRSWLVLKVALWS